MKTETETLVESTDAVSLLVQKQNESEKRRHALTRDLALVKSHRRPITGEPREDDADSVYNAGIDRKANEIENEIQKCVDGFNDLQAQINKIQKADESRARVARCPDADEKKNLARLKEMETEIRDLQKSKAPAEVVDKLRSELAMWIKKCRLRELYDSYNTLASQLAPTLSEIQQILSSTPNPADREALDEVSSGPSHPILEIRCLPKRFFPPEVYAWETAPRFGDGTNLYWWYPVNA